VVHDVFPPRLLRFDAGTRTVTRHAFDDMILRLVRWNDTLYAATTEGFEVFRAGRREWYLFEPERDGGFEVRRAR